VSRTGWWGPFDHARHIHEPIRIHDHSPFQISTMAALFTGGTTQLTYSKRISKQTHIQGNCKPKFGEKNEN
jgi:hypothetical protein